MILIAGIVSGCATTTSTGDFCVVASPIRPAASDQVDDMTKRQIVSHNDYGSRACGWRP